MDCNRGGGGTCTDIIIGLLTPALPAVVAVLLKRRLQENAQIF